MSEESVEEAKHQTEPTEESKEKAITCGIIMPISGSNDTYTSKHWEDVRAIIDEVVVDAGFFPQIVSDANEVGIIHERIVGNIYGNPIVICDVSSKNPNVMFELGLRLAFDKATIIIKDQATNYNFDTSPIEHLEYPTDLRYTEIIKFKSALKRKLLATYTASQNQEYSTFLKNFIQYKPKKLEEREISGFDLLTKRLDNLTAAVEKLASKDVGRIGNNKRSSKTFYDKFNPLFTTVNEKVRDALIESFHDYLKNVSQSKLSKEETVNSFLAQKPNEYSIMYQYISREEVIDLLNTIYDNAA